MRRRRCVPATGRAITLAPVNLVLLEPAELGHPLPLADRRARHILAVLRRSVGDTFDAGVIDGPRGKATLTAIDAAAIAFSFEATAPPAPPEPIALIVGLPRPQTARDILRDATTLGASALHFVRTQKGEASYAQSALWTAGEWRRHAIAGAEQAFATTLPAVSHGRSIVEVVGAIAPGSMRLALDNYESPVALGAAPLRLDAPVVLAVGGERGWSAAERSLLRAEGFAFTHLGPRVLRAETAVIAALTILRTRRGLM
ncbi:MAG: 16S rRNA (uracil(1498)-N(3))-methyltransferase [Opitutaceae bacterium]|nr:16S rRNA (uracil(1498)-N(3))-methyltransferase [Opitutaceae bacterium]